MIKSSRLGSPETLQPFFIITSPSEEEGGGEGKNHYVRPYNHYVRTPMNKGFQIK
jgi:hypothetical protein